MFASRAIMSMALAGVDLFAAIVFCGFTEGVAYLRLFLLAAFIASLLLMHASVCFYKAFQRKWDPINLLVTAGIVPTLCLAGVAVTAISEILRR
jgi:hypothetical protein